MSRGLLFVLSGPSGCGKSTLLKELMQELPGLAFSVSHTTRPPRPGEINGLHYHFIDQAAFVTLRDQKPSAFLECAEVHGFLYGTSFGSLRQQQEAGLDVLLDIDVQGAAQVQIRSAAISIFIAPPSMRELAARLRNRGTESEERIALRLENARNELQQAHRYDYLLINDQVTKGVEGLRSIIIAERLRVRRDRDGKEQERTR